MGRMNISIGWTFVENRRRIKGEKQEKMGNDVEDRANFLDFLTKEIVVIMVKFS